MKSRGWSTQANICNDCERRPEHEKRSQLPIPPSVLIHSVMQVTVEMPDQVARQWGETPNAVGRHVLEDAAVEG